jgi:hypothetical protein
MDETEETKVEGEMAPEMEAPATEEMPAEETTEEAAA